MGMAAMTAWRPGRAMTSYSAAWAMTCWWVVTVTMCCLAKTATTRWMVVAASISCWAAMATTPCASARALATAAMPRVALVMIC
ncbi:hypothetical protein D3C85_1460190 [compost metagenome]